MRTRCLLFVFIVIGFCGEAQQPTLMLPIGHTRIVETAYYSPDGKFIVTASWDRTAKIWAADDGKLIKELKGHTDFVNSAIFSPDGKKIISASADQTYKIWNAYDGRLLQEIKTDHWLNYAGYSPDEKWIVTAGGRLAEIWDATTGKKLGELAGHKGRVVVAVFSPDGKFIATASDDSTVRIWSVATRKQVWELRAHTSIVTFVSYSPDGKYVVSASKDNTAKVWDVALGKLVYDLRDHPNRVNSATFSPDGKYILTASFGEPARLWSAANGMLLKRLDSDISTAAYSPDGNRIIGVGSNLANICDAASGKILQTLKGHTTDVRVVAFSNDSKYLAMANEENLSIWQIGMGKMERMIYGQVLGLEFLAYTPDGKHLVSGYTDGNIKIWDPANGKLERQWKGDKIKIESLALSADGRFLTTSGSENSVRIWDINDGKLVKEFDGYNKAVNSTCFSPDGKSIVTSDKDSMIRMLNVDDGRVLIEFKRKTWIQNLACFSPDGKSILVSVDEEAMIWDVNTGKLIKEFPAQEPFIRSINFSPDGKTILIVSDQTANTWDIASGKIIAELRGHNNIINSATYSPDGKYIATASWDNTAKMWDAHTGELIYTIITTGRTHHLVLDKYDRYDGSAQARELLYFTCGRELISLDQVKDQLWVPDLAKRIINGDSINAPKLSDLDICGLVPSVEQVSDNNPQRYHFRITPGRGGLGETVLSVNGIEAQKYKVAELTRKGNAYELIIAKSQLQYFLKTDEENKITLKAYTSANNISSRGVSINEGITKKSQAQPHLYALMIGVSDYKGDELDLKFAAKDAGDLSTLVKASASKLLGENRVHTYNLVTGKTEYAFPEKAAIHKALTDIGNKTTANDILLIFFAGHGMTTGKGGKQFYFLTADASKATAADATDKVGISTRELIDWIQPSNIKAQKRILIFDACNSGQIINDIAGKDFAVRNDDRVQQVKAIDKLNEKAGLFILSASASSQNAYEMTRYSQGLLTYSLLRVIKQQPDILEDGKYLNVSRWFNAAGKTVSDLSRENGARQEPQLISNTNFNIGIVDDDVVARISLANEKPLFTGSIFFNSAVQDDDLELSKMINLQLFENSSRGYEEKIMYTVTANTQDAYTLTGAYETAGDSISVKVNIKQNKEIKYRFELKDTKDKLKELVAHITDKAIELVK